MIFDLASEFYGQVRALLISQNDLEVLCEVVQILRCEVTDDKIKTWGTYKL